MHTRPSGLTCIMHETAVSMIANPAVMKKSPDPRLQANMTRGHWSSPAGPILLCSSNPRRLLRAELSWEHSAEFHFHNHALQGGPSTCPYNSCIGAMYSSLRLSAMLHVLGSSKPTNKCRGKLFCLESYHTLTKAISVINAAQAPSKQ